MRRTSYRIHRSRQTKKADSNKSVEEIVRELQHTPPKKGDYRERSLNIHGFICARCGKEFDHKTNHLLTVHHKDGNHLNNPPDGSNWENLCVYCHDEEHSW
ncbi:MAG: HNH nuclease family protein [Deltaproteobacteria bacterium]|nr:HNH nuclease family protein [Deltaproteobacteria bacterium]